jgi:hypothetical protein
MPANDSDSTYVRLVSRASSVTREIYVDQYSGRILGRKELANQLIWKIHERHINLGAGVAGGRIVFYASIGLLGLAISGLYLWWPGASSPFAPDDSSPKPITTFTVVWAFGRVWLWRCLPSRASTCICKPTAVCST